jgi:hypothetical protein
MNDLWVYDVTTSEWTWIAGPDSANNLGVYGSGGFPGGRHYAASWVNSSSLFLFGGTGYDGANSSLQTEQGEAVYLNDLWAFDTTQSEWILLSGGSVGNQNNTMLYPGGRHSVLVTPTSAGVLLIGGFGIDTKASRGTLLA